MLIVLADDSVAFRAGLADFLRDLGHDVLEANNGREALAIYRQVRPDVLLSDVEMPEMDGFAATRAIHTQHPEARILLMSALVTPERMDRAICSGALGLLDKAVVQDLVRRLELLSPAPQGCVS